MIRKPLRALFGIFLGKRKAAIAAELADGLAKKALDKPTKGLASKLDEVL